MIHEPDHIDRPTSLGGRDFAIGILTVTAMILLATLVLIHVHQPSSAMAFAQTGSAGKYLVATGQLETNIEMLHVMNTEVGQINSYGFDNDAGTVVLLERTDIAGLTQGLQNRRGGRGRR